MRNTNCKGSTLIEALIVVAIAAVLMSLLLPAVAASRAAARRLECQSKIRQLGLALNHYADAWGTLPPGTSMGVERKYQGWYVQLLPFLEDNATYQKIESNFQNSRFAFDVRFHPEIFLPRPIFGCPEDSRISETVLSVNTRNRVALSSFQGCAGESSLKQDGVLFGGSKVRFAEISDGLSNTISIGERPSSKNNDYGWWYAGYGNGDGTLDHTIGTREVASSRYASCSTPSSFRNGSIEIECDLSHYWSMHAGLCHFAMMDGSVHSFSYDAPEVLVKLSTRAGQEIASPE